MPRRSSRGEWWISRHFSFGPLPRLVSVPTQPAYPTSKAHGQGRVGVSTSWRVAVAGGRRSKCGFDRTPTTGEVGIAFPAGSTGRACGREARPRRRSYGARARTRRTASCCAPVCDTKRMRTLVEQVHRKGCSPRNPIAAIGRYARLGEWRNALLFPRLAFSE